MTSDIGKLPILVALALTIQGCTEHVTALSSYEASRRTSANAEDTPCVLLSATHASSAQAARIPAQDIPFPLPPATSARRDRTGRLLLHVVAGDFTRATDGVSKHFGIACFVPTDFSGARFLELLSRSGHTAAVSQLHTSSSEVTTHARTRLSIEAARELMRPLMEQSGQIATKTVRSDVEGFIPTAKHESDEPVRLPTARVYADRYRYVLNFTEVYWLLHDAGAWAGTYNLERTFVDCPEASEQYIAELDALGTLQEDSAHMHEAIRATSQYVCVPRSDGMRTCIDWFISSKKAFLVGDGDGRTYDSTAGYQGSRVQMYIDFDAKVAEAYVNHSTVGWGEDHRGVAPYPHEKKDMQIIVLSDTVNVVEAHLYNGFCTALGRALCPSIDTYIEFRKRDGQWVPTMVRRDGFPTLHIMRQDDYGVFHTLLRDPESNSAALITLGRTIEKWRQDMRLPAGCQLQ